MATLEFYFDCSSPWTYLAFHQVQNVAANTGCELVWKPILVGGVFNAVNPAVYEMRAQPVKPRAAYYAKDLNDWATLYGLKIGRPTVFPVNSVNAMRGAFIALDAGLLPQYARAVFEAYWGQLEDISQDAVLRTIVSQVGLDADTFFDAIAQKTTKQRLRQNTDDLIARGGFGSPTMFVNATDMYFGNDRLELVRHAIEQSAQ